MSAPAAPAPCPRCGAKGHDAGAQFCRSCGSSLGEGVGDPLVGRVLLERYRVERLLGEGGMARVYAAQQRVGTVSRTVAVKVLTSAASRDPTIVARLEREAATIVQLQHPNTVRLLDFGEEDGRLILVMEYLPGRSLAELLAQGPMDLGRALAIVAQLAGSLGEAHKLGVVHRDLKPENVLVVGGGSVPFVKLLDFGVARHSEASAGSTLTAHGMLVGTPAYMAPEQFEGVPVDVRADVYSLALVLYRMLAGRLPWSARTPYEWAHHHTLNKPPLLTDFAPWAPPGLAAALDRALRKKPDERPATVEAFLTELTGLDAATLEWSALVGRALQQPPGAPPSLPAVDPAQVLPSLASAPPELPRQRPLWPALVGLFVVGSGAGFALVYALSR